MDSRATLAGGQQGFDVANEAMADTADEKIRADATKVCGAILAVLNGYTQWKLQGKLPAVAQAWIDKSIDLFR